MKRLTVLLVAVVVAVLGLTPLASQANAVPQTKGGRTDVNAPAVPGEFIIKFRAGTDPARGADAARALGGRAIRSLAALGASTFEFPALKSGNTSRGAAEALINQLKQDPSVEYVEPNYLYTINFTPNDPSLSQQYGWTNIKAYSAWDVTKGSASTVIAVVDTGAQLNHPDLASKIVAGYDYVDNDATPTDGNGHGTHVSGTSAALTNNGTGGAGMCPNCSIMPVRVLDNAGSGTLDGVANGITWAADHGAKVINMSLGGGGSATLQNAVDYAWNRGVFMACAAGNDNTSSTANSYPGAYTNCFAVASTTNTDARSSFSNYGTWVEAAAPGTNIYSTWLNSGYNTISGTSMATPHVAGLAGLLASQGLTNAQIKQRLCDTADKISGTGTYWTCGRINAYAAVTGGTTTTPTPTPTTPPSTGTEKIVNGGFESGAAPWVQAASGGYAVIDATRPHAGTKSAYLGGYNGASDLIYQTVTVPANGTLSYWRYISTQETSHSYDFLYVRVYNTGGTLLATLRTWSDGSPLNAWSQDSISLANYAGQTVRISFNATNDSSLPTSFFVDDVSVK